MLSVGFGLILERCFFEPTNIVSGGNLTDNKDLLRLG